MNCLMHPKSKLQKTSLSNCPLALYGCIILGLFQNRITQNRRFLCTFPRGLLCFQNEQNIIPFILVPIYSRMNGMKGIPFIWNRQNRICVLLGNFWREILRSSRHSSSSQVTYTKGIPFSEGAFFSKLKFRLSCYS